MLDIKAMSVVAMLVSEDCILTPFLELTLLLSEVTLLFSEFIVLLF